jgi:hypothetical protein
MLELFTSLSNAFPGASVAFGEVHAALNTGDYDGDLSGAGLTSEDIEPKRKGFYYNFGAVLRCA